MIYLTICYTCQSRSSCKLAVCFFFFSFCYFSSTILLFFSACINRFVLVSSNISFTPNFIVPLIIEMRGLLLQKNLICCTADRLTLMFKAFFAFQSLPSIYLLRCVTIQSTNTKSILKIVICGLKPHFIISHHSFKPNEKFRKNTLLTYKIRQY